MSPVRTFDITEDPQEPRVAQARLHSKQASLCDVVSSAKDMQNSPDKQEVSSGHRSEHFIIENFIEKIFRKSRNLFSLQPTHRSRGTNEESGPR